MVYLPLKKVYHKKVPFKFKDGLDESQKEGTNQIWIDVYNIIEFLKKNRSEVYLEDKKTNDYERKYDFIDSNCFD